MNPELLILFVDSMPFALLPHTEWMRQAPEACSICPGFGYSVNIHA